MISIDETKCNGCKMCVWVCPHDVLEMNGESALAAHPENCIECGACMLNCKPEAVSVVKGTGCIFYIIKEDILGIKDKEAACCG